MEGPDSGPGTEDQNNGPKVTLQRVFNITAREEQTARKEGRAAPKTYSLLNKRAPNRKPDLIN